MVHVSALEWYLGADLTLGELLIHCWYAFVFCSVVLAWPTPDARRNAFVAFLHVAWSTYDDKEAGELLLPKISLLVRNTGVTKLLM